MFVFNRQQFENADNIFEATDSKSLEEFIKECNNITYSLDIKLLKFIIISNILSVHNLINDIETQIYNLDDMVEKYSEQHVNIRDFDEKEKTIRHNNFILAIQIFKLSIFVYISSKKYDILDSYKYKIYKNLFLKFRQMVKHFNFLYYRSWREFIGNLEQNYPYMELYTLKLMELNHFLTYSQIFMRYLY